MHDSIHGPPVQLLVRNYLQRQLILDFVALHSLYSRRKSTCARTVHVCQHNTSCGTPSLPYLEGIVTIARDAFVDGQQKQVKAIVVPLVQERHDVS